MRVAKKTFDGGKMVRRQNIRSQQQHVEPLPERGPGKHTSLSAMEIVFTRQLSPLPRFMVSAGNILTKPAL